MQHQFFTPFQYNHRQARHSSAVEIPTPYSARVVVVQPGRCGDTIVDLAENEPHLEGLTQYFAKRFAVLGASAAAEVKTLMDYGASITALPEELVQACGDNREWRKLHKRRLLLGMRVS